MSMINENFTRKLGLDKFMINQVYDILKSLESANILQINEGNGKKKSAISSLMLTKKRVTGQNINGKNFMVELRVDIEELEDALNKCELRDIWNLNQLSL